MPRPFGPQHKAKKCQIYVKIAESDYNKACIWKRLTLPGILSIILISLRVEVAEILDFLVHAKILPLWKAFLNQLTTFNSQHWARNT